MYFCSREISVRFLRLILVLSLALSLLIAIPTEKSVANQPAKFVGNELIVQFSAKSSAKERSSLLTRIGATSRKQISPFVSGLDLITLKSDQSVQAVIKGLENNPLVDYAEPNYYTKILESSNDPRFVSGEQWNLRGALSTPISQYGVGADTAWQSGRTGNREKVFVAVLDTGIDINHEDLQQNIWINNQNQLTVGIDSPGDPFYGQTSGWNFVDGNSNVQPANESESHGTHVSGIIGAVGNNNIGVAGVNWNVGIIPVKILSNLGGTIAMAIAGLDYVTALRTKKGIPIVATNNSWSFGAIYSEALRDAIRRGGDAGIIFVAAAGNDGANNDTSFQYPSNYKCKTGIRIWNCVVSVAATNSEGGLSSFSNYGKELVSIGAPGENILSTVPNNRYDTKSGTSMAAPHVSGAVALCVSVNRSMSASNLVEALNVSSSKVNSLSQKTVSGGILNIGALADTCSQYLASYSGFPSEVSSTAIYIDRINLRWNATTKGEYEQEIQMSVGSLGCSGEFKHYAYIGPGLDSYPITSLRESEFYCFRIRANRDLVKGDWKNSNMSITWSSNSPFITGRVLMYDGVTPANNVNVKWKAGISTTDPTGALVSKTDYEGNYVLQVPSGVEGALYVEVLNGKSTSPRLPGRLSGGEKITVTSDTNVNLILPKLNQFKIKVVDDLGLPIPNAVLTFNNTNNSMNCVWPSVYGNSNPWKLFQGTGVWSGNEIYKSCYYFHANDVADGNGEASAVVAAARSVMITATHPSDTARAASVTVDGSSINEVTIVITTKKVTISGKVYMFDGTTPVQNLVVNWNTAVAGGTTPKASTVTDSGGNYSLQVPSGVEGILYVETPRLMPSYADGQAGNVLKYPNPQLPAGLQGGEKITVTSDTSIALTIPELLKLKLKVVDAYTNQPVVGAKVNFDNTGTSMNCVWSSVYGNSNPWKLFQGTGVWSGNEIYKSCYYFYSNDISNSSGEVTVVVASPRSFSISATHPLDPVRTGRINISPDTNIKNLELTLTIPGTPNIPKQPTATPLLGEVVLNWEEPYDGGAFIDYYQVWQSTNADGPYSLVSSGTCAGNIDPTWRSCKVTGLDSATIYYFAIVAHNVVGYSGKSLSIEVRTQDSLALTPSFSTPVSTSTGFTVNITNYDAAYTFTPTASSGTVTAGVASGSILPLTVTGLAPGTSATVTVTTTRTGYVSGSNQISASATTGAALTPSFSTPVSTSTGFTVNITNYDAAYTFTPTASSGTVTAGVASGSILPLTVTGLDSGVAIVGVRTTRTGFFSSSSEVLGRALPSITSVNSTSGALGSVLVISGSNLWGSTSVTIGNLNTAIARYWVISNNTIIVSVASSVSGILRVTTPAGTGTGPTINISSQRVAPGKITLSKSSGGTGTSVLLSGANLGATTSVIRGRTQIPFRVVSTNQIVIALPAGLSSGAFSITTPGGTVNSPNFTILSSLSLPTISNSIQSISRLNMLSVTGNNIGAVTAMLLNGAAFTDYVVTSDTSILLRIPSTLNLGTLTIAITTFGGTATSNSIVVI
jgi:subtilisin family serine protease